MLACIILAQSLAFLALRLFSFQVLLILNHRCDMTHSYAGHDSRVLFCLIFGRSCIASVHFFFLVLFIVNHRSDMTHSCAGHASCVISADKYM